jgi:uncharacterized protein YndB with AHSA1/START domain
VAVSNENSADDGAQFVVTRSFDAPRELVWKVYSEIGHLKHWWGPKGFGWIAGTLDFRPGGMFHYCMRSPDGQEMWGKFVYREIAKPEKIVFVNAFSDAKGGTTRAPFAPDWPLEVLNTVTLVEHKGRTTLTMRGAPFNATAAERARFGAMRPQLDQGFAGTFAQLAEYLKSQAST